MGITIVQKSDLSKPKAGSKQALVLAGGAISGGAFKVGGLMAINPPTLNAPPLMAPPASTNACLEPALGFDKSDF